MLTTKQAEVVGHTLCFILECCLSEIHVHVYTHVHVRFHNKVIGVYIAIRLNT